MVLSRRTSLLGAALALSALLIGMWAWFGHGEKEVAGPASEQVENSKNAFGPLPTDNPSGQGDAEQDQAPRIATTVPEVVQDAALDVIADPTKVWGRVVSDESGIGIPGAQVTLLVRDADDFWNLDIEYGQHEEELGSRTTDAEGRFDFGVTRGRPYRLRANASGFAPATRLDVLGGSEVVIRVTVGATVEGTVREESGGMGVAEVPIRIFVQGESIALAQGRTALDGSFRFEGLQEASVYVSVSPQTQVPSPWQGLKLESGETYHLEFLLERGRSVSGLVTDASTGAPVPDAELSDSWTFRRQIASAGDGSFRFEGLDPDGELHVRAPGFAAQARQLKPDEDQLVFALLRGGEVRGQVVDEDGAPRPDAYIAAAASYMLTPGMEHTDWLRAKIAADGWFSVRGLAPQHVYQLYIRAPNTGTRVYVLPQPVGAGEVLELGTLVLLAAGGLEGVVVDEEGALLSAASVSLIGVNQDVQRLRTEGAPPSGPIVTQLQDRSSSTAADGSFRFGGVSSGEYTLAVRSSRRAPTQRFGPFVVEDGIVRDDLRLVLKRGLSIRGQVRTSQSADTVDLQRIQLYAKSDGGRFQWASADSEGFFAFEGLDPGTYRILPFATPQGWSLNTIAAVEAGENALELMLVPAEQIEGRVIDASGAGVLATVLYIESGGSIFKEAKTDAEGRFALEVAPDFLGKIHASGKNGKRSAAIEDVTAGTTELLLTLP